MRSPRSGFVICSQIILQIFSSKTIFSVSIFSPITFRFISYNSSVPQAILIYTRKLFDVPTWISKRHGTFDMSKLNSKSPTLSHYIPLPVISSFIDTTSCIQLCTSDTSCSLIFLKINQLISNSGWSTS